jgi:dTDP-glucose 4,6-dehydratase
LELNIKNLLITGGAGFIGSYFTKLSLDEGFNVTVIDKLNYASSIDKIKKFKKFKNFEFFHGSILDETLLISILTKKNYDAIVNFAAETHVDRSIESSSEFVLTNTLGVEKLLSISKEHCLKNKNFKFIQISTDEVFGSILTGSFTEKSKYQPNSPYAASKAAGDHLVYSFYKTYGYPGIITNCSNNYGENQFPEKLVPLLIIKALQGLRLPIYGNGAQMRDWIHVQDHCDAIMLILYRGKIGEQYLIGADNCIKNIDMANKICNILNEIKPPKSYKYNDLIHYVKDRPGHDFRYSINSSKIKKQLGWIPKINFNNGLKQTINWYVNNKKIWEKILKNKYSGERIGLI